jgi:hypothetical protein
VFDVAKIVEDLDYFFLDLGTIKVYLMKKAIWAA